MNDLTKQWKEGKLSGLYWCKITVSPYIEMVYVDSIDKDYMIQVLAKVPSYDEWTKIENVCLENETLRLKIAKLEEQLNIAVKALKSIQNEDIDGGLSMFCANILDEIKEVK